MTSEEDMQRMLAEVSNALLGVVNDVVGDDADPEVRNSAVRTVAKATMMVTIAMGVSVGYSVEEMTDWVRHCEVIRMSAPGAPVSTSRPN